MRYTAAPDRRSELERLLADEGYVASADVAERMGVSEMTIRRDLRLLESDGRVRRVAGGAVAASGGEPFERRDQVDIGYKRVIAEAAAREIGAARTVALDAGTTVASLAPLVRADLVVTHSLPVIASLAARRPDALMGVGGLYQRDTRSFAGPGAEAALRELRIEVAVLSCTAAGTDGVWGSSALDAALKRVMAAQADRVIVLADAGKLTARAALRILPLDAVDVLVTDARADAGLVADLRAAGVDVRVAG